MTGLTVTLSVVAFFVINNSKGGIMGSKVTIKAGQVEFSYEGENDLSVKDIEELFSHIEGLCTKVAKDVIATPTPPPAAAAGEGVGASGEKINLHMNSIAEKLGTKSGTDLAVAAAASLQLVKDHETFSRADLLSEMKLATKYYKQSMNSNLTKSINTLLSNKMNQNSNDKYSLKADVLLNLRKQLDQ